MKKIVSKILKYIVSFIIVILVFNVSLFLVCLIDSRTIENNVKESSKVLSKQGTFYTLSRDLKLINNNYTDSIIINEAYAVDNKHPLESYMKVRRNYKSGETTKQLKEKNGEVFSVNYSNKKRKEAYGYNTVNELSDFVNGKIHWSINYGRYWHGYLLLYRPLLLIFNISQIRILSLIVLTSLFIYFIYLLNKRFSKNIAIIFGMSLLCSGYFSATYSLESTPIFLLMIVSSIIFLKIIDKIKDVGLYMFVVGCLSNFIDFLTVPLITLGMLCALYLLKLIEENKDFKKCLIFLIKCSILWVIGYIGTWVTKWVLYDLIINDGKSMINIGLSQMSYRTQRTNEIADEDKNYIKTIVDILRRSSIYILLTTFILLAINKFKIFLNKTKNSAMIFFVLALYPIVWYIVLANHTVLHSFFTYRQSLVYMIGMLLFVNYLLFSNKRSKDNK